MLPGGLASDLGWAVAEGGGAVMKRLRYRTAARTGPSSFGSAITYRSLAVVDSRFPVPTAGPETTILAAIPALQQLTSLLPPHNQHLQLRRICTCHNG